MRVGVGLPTSTPGADRDLILSWARRAETGPFSSLGVIDRVPYDAGDPLATLAAAAAVTSTIRLVTMVVVAPLRDVAVLAKQVATVDALSDGRLTLGVSIGARHEDYAAAGVPTGERGRLLSDQLAALRELWETRTVAPATSIPDGPDLLVGGGSPVSFLRAARYGDGYVHGGGPPRAFAAAATRARAAWLDLERPGRPQLWGQVYSALSDPAAGAAYLRDYYGFTGAFVERIAAGLLTSPEAVSDVVRGYAEAGCDELVVLPAVSDLAELDAVAEVIAA